jgi:PAS domain S-box-containing protein
LAVIAAQSILRPLGLEEQHLRADSAARAIEEKERRLLLQTGLQGAVIELQSRVIAGDDPLLVLNDLLRHLVNLSGSTAGVVLEQQRQESGLMSWRSVVTDHIAALSLSGVEGQALQRLAAGRAPLTIAAQSGPSQEILRKMRPDVQSWLMLALPGDNALLGLGGRVDGYDQDIADLLRSMTDVPAQLLAASRRHFATQTPSGAIGARRALPHLPDAHLATVLGEIAGVVWSASLPDFDLTYVSPSIEKLLGHTADAFLGHRDFLDEITPPKDQVLRVDAVNRAMEGEPFDLVHRLICADGSLRWVRCKANVATDHSGKPVRLDGVLTDVTADRLTLERGRQSDALYRAVVEDQQEAIIRFRPDHTVTFANRQYADFYNLAPEDLLGIRLTDLLTPQELADISARLGGLTREQPSCLHEYEKPLPGGARRWIRWVNRALFDSFGTISEFQCVGHDISDLKRLEQELEDGRELLSLVVTSSGDGIFEWHVDSNHVWLSPRWKEMFGYEDAELPNSLGTWEDLVDPDDRQRILREIDAYLRHPLGVLRTWGRYRHRNGSIVHVESRIVCRQTDGSRGVRLVGAMSDVTTKVVADQQMRDAIDSLSDGFAWFDAEDRLIMHNGRFLEFFPFLAPMGDLTGVPFIDMVCHPAGEMGRMPDPQGYVTERMQQHRDGGSFELPLYNGGWVRVSERRTKDGGIVSIWSDITELKRAKQRLLDAVAAIQEGFLLVGPDDRVILSNQRCRDMYEIAGHLLRPGCSYEEFLRYGAENGQFIDAVGRSEDYVLEVMALLHNEQDVRIERELAGGRWVLISQRRMSDGSVVSIRTDLTSQKRREAELEAAHDQLEQQAATLVELAEKLEEARIGAVEASRAKTRFLAHMSHELRTPLNAVLGFTRLMDDELFGPIGVPKYKEYIGLIHESGAHLLSLINDVLDLSKIEAGRMELDRRLISVAELAMSSTRLMEGLAKDRQIKLLVQVMPDCDAMYGDERSLKQIVINLLSNALKFTQAGGRVTLSFARRDDGGTVVTVVDTGIGMTADDIIKALDPFGQVDGEIARQHHGTGLGLPLVKAMTEAHGGYLTVDSEPGVGTTMSVHLPGEAGAFAGMVQSGVARQPAAAGLTTKAAIDAPPPTESTSRAPHSDDVVLFPSLAASLAEQPQGYVGERMTPHHNRRVLLAEDNPVNQRLVLDILKDLPVDVVCVADGEEAVRAVAAGDYDLVLMDVQMPRMGGVEAAQRIRSSGGDHRHVPIIAVTAHATEGDQARFLAAGMDAYLAKPVDVAVLIDLVRRYLKLESGATAAVSQELRA